MILLTCPDCGNKNWRLFMTETFPQKWKFNPCICLLKWKERFRTDNLVTVCMNAATFIGDDNASRAIRELS